MASVVSMPTINITELLNQIFPDLNTLEDLIRKSLESFKEANRLRRVYPKVVELRKQFIVVVEKNAEQVLRIKPYCDDVAIYCDGASNKQIQITDIREILPNLRADAVRHAQALKELKTRYQSVVDEIRDYLTELHHEKNEEDFKARRDRALDLISYVAITTAFSGIACYSISMIFTGQAEPCHSRTVSSEPTNPNMSSTNEYAEESGSITMSSRLAQTELNTTGEDGEFTMICNETKNCTDNSTALNETNNNGNLSAIANSTFCRITSALHLTPRYYPYFGMPLALVMLFWGWRPRILSRMPNGFKRLLPRCLVTFLSFIPGVSRRTSNDKKYEDFTLFLETLYRIRIPAIIENIGTLVNFFDNQVNGFDTMIERLESIDDQSFLNLSLEVGQKTVQIWNERKQNCGESFLRINRIVTSDELA
ncbi:4007_t:CDS:1 [Paraglomus occultum]|uniref:4007_t:CDS:1 n=1 Tax=Paraglomus occultum TaxID=144539 RepID=A0A9N9AAU5_9GLOM|nr:4007_t:CDS:1 [Paraglomus occultum]